MNLAYTFVVATGLAAASSTPHFDSYTDAYWTAHDEARPMLVVLNPAAGDGDQISVETLREDARVAELLDNYVVAEIDTTTDHGKKVYESFGKPALPRVVVIDREQDKQVYQSTGKPTVESFRGVLSTYKIGTATPVVATQPAQVQSAPAQSFGSFYGTGDCPSCRNQFGYR